MLTLYFTSQSFNNHLLEISRIFAHQCWCVVRANRLFDAIFFISFAVFFETLFLFVFVYHYAFMVCLFTSVLFAFYHI